MLYPDHVTYRDEEAAERARQYARDYYKRNREVVKARRAAYVKANPEKCKAAVASYRERHPDRVRATMQVVNNRRRVTKQAGDLTQAEWRQILEEFDHACAYCQARDVPIEQEHMTPVSRGGRHTKTNVVPACRPCNNRKQARTIFEFLAA